MGRKCSYCGNIGHNSRICTSTKRGTGTTASAAVGVRLFGVQLMSMSTSPSSSVSVKKSLSMDCLTSITHPASSPPTSSLTSSRLSINESEKTSIGYLSDGLLRPAQERKKGIPWTEEEHRAFLLGLEKLGKGDWRGVSRNFVTTRTPTQVASHAQKYFLRQSSPSTKKRRSSLFDMVEGRNTVLMQNSRNKPNDSISPSRYISIKSVNHEARHYNSPLIGLNSGKEVEYSYQKVDLSQQISHHHAIPIWGNGSLISSQSNSLTYRQENPTSSIPSPDLELILAAPEQVVQTKSSSNSLLGGPISVSY